MDKMQREGRQRGQKEKVEKRERMGEKRKGVVKEREGEKASIPNFNVNDTTTSTSRCQ